MRVLLIALLAAISYAQTECNFDRDLCEDFCDVPCEELRWDEGNGGEFFGDPKKLCNTCPSPAEVKENCPHLVLDREFMCRPGAEGYEPTQRTRFYVSDAGSPHRFKVSKLTGSNGWTDRLSFYAYDSQFRDSTAFYVSEAYRPHRFKISMEPACCGWTDVFQFYAWEKQNWELGDQRTQFYVSEAHRPHRFQISKDPACCGWTDKFSFWAFDEPCDDYSCGVSASASALETESERLMLTNKALLEALQSLTQE